MGTFGYRPRTSDANALSAQSPDSFSRRLNLFERLRGSKGSEEETYIRLLTLQGGDITARFNSLNCQLVSLTHSGVEFMAGGGKPEDLKTGQERSLWPNSEITMFPLVGPANNGRLLINGIEYPMPQHGLPRYLPYTIDASRQVSWNRLTFAQEYAANTELPTSKGPAAFPYSFSLKKSFEIHKTNSLYVAFEIENKSDAPMPYALGWHPAFRAVGNACVKVSGADYTLEGIKAVSKTGAVVLENLPTVGNIEYASGIGRVLILSNFGHAQLWSPEAQDLICIEPITATPFSRYKYSGELSRAPYFKLLEPSQKAEYNVVLAISLIR